MKDFVIRVVEIIAWLTIIFSTLGGYFIMYKVGYVIVPGLLPGNNVFAGILGGLTGFGLGCVASGTWFVLSAIHKDIRTLREVAVWGYRNRNNRKDRTPEAFESLSTQ
ncbi:MAG: hypothetical protein ACOH2O_12040 [Pseudomonas sp.]